MSLLRALVATVTLSLALTACSAARNDPGAPAGATPDWTHVDLPADALPSTPERVVEDAIGAQGRLPATAIGTIAQPGHAPQAVVWRPSARGTGREHPLDVPGPYSSPADIATRDGATYIVGYSWAAGVGTSWALRSDDRRTWQPVRLPEKIDARGMTAEALLLSHGRADAIVVGHDHAAVVDLATGAVADLPTSDGFRPDGIAGAASLGRRRIVLVEGTDGDGLRLVVPIVSTSDGPWTNGSPLASTDTVVEGVTVATVRTGSRLIATGSQLTGDQQRPMVWTSDDGDLWSADRVDYAEADGPDTSLAAPVSAPSGTYTAVDDGNSLSTTILRRGDDGTWRSWGHPVARWTELWDAPVLAPVGESVIVIRSANGAFQSAMATATGIQWYDDAPQASEPADRWLAALPQGPGVELFGGRDVVTVRPDTGWEMRTHITSFTVRGTRLRRGPWAPRGARDLVDLDAATAPDGTRIVVGEQVVRDAGGAGSVRLVGWRHTGTGPWRAVSGLDVSDNAYVTSIEYLHGTWLITGHASDSVTAAGELTAAAWTSNDGMSWTRQGSPFDASTDTWLQSGCRLPDGDLMAIGSESDPRSTLEPFALRKDGTKWSRMRLHGIDSRAASVGSCARVDDITLIQTWSTYGGALWRSTDGRGWERVDIADKYDVVRGVTAVAGGVIAHGRVQSGALSQPTVWLSTDGVDWVPVDVPIERPLIIDHVTLVGHRLFVSMSGDGGPAVLVLENVAELLAGGPQS